MQFPELQGIANGFVSACQALGAAILVAMVCLVALVTLTSFGNEHKQAWAKAAGVGVVIGFALLMAAPLLGAVIQRIFPIHGP